ncbi:guanine nucleotide exchange factor VAV2 isoform X1, partial [Tachysurus ichikawai]
MSRRETGLTQLHCRMLKDVYKVLYSEHLCAAVFSLQIFSYFLSHARILAASCASYNFSFLSPQGLNFSSQSSTPFWS